ncbi:hypothetical protein [Sorangium sp. So ce295]|uniref:hypothetical protein n=1 Tax=Sorangium sp. So ce295 TaxID=3133295 RepID=UPI003F61BF53
MQLPGGRSRLERRAHRPVNPGVGWWDRPPSVAERTQIALFNASRLAAAFELGRRYHAARARRGALLTHGCARASRR